MPPLRVIAVTAASYIEHDAAICAIAKLSRYTRDFTSHRFFREDIQNTYAKGEVGVALAGAKVVGFVYIKHLKLKSRPMSVIHYMGSDPANQLKGVGRALLEWAVETSPHKRVQLSCEASNSGGLAFYIACGCVSVGSGIYGTKNPRPYTRFEKGCE